MLRPVLEQYGLAGRGAPRRGAARPASLAVRAARAEAHLVADAACRSPRTRALAHCTWNTRASSRTRSSCRSTRTSSCTASLKAQADELGDEVSFKRTDLGLFDLDTAARTITCRLVEVKCYTGVGDLAQPTTRSRPSIAEQIAQSEQVLAHHFDPQRTPQDRPDRAFKTRELGALLEFYLERAERYGAIGREAAEEARYFLHTLDDGYRLDLHAQRAHLRLRQAGHASRPRRGWHRVPPHRRQPDSPARRGCRADARRRRPRHPSQLEPECSSRPAKRGRAHPASASVRRPSRRSTQRPSSARSATVRLLGRARASRRDASRQPASRPRLAATAGRSHVPARWSRPRRTH